MPVLRAPVSPYRFRSGYYYYFDYINGAVAGSTQAVATNLYTAPTYFPSPVSIQEIGCWVVTGQSASTIRFAIYNDTGYGWPNSLLLDTGTIATTSSGAAAFSTAAPLPMTLPAGVLWVGAVSTGATGPSISTYSGASVGPIPYTTRQPGVQNFTGIYKAVTSSIPPLTFPSTIDGNTSFHFQVWFKVS